LKDGGQLQLCMVDYDISKFSLMGSVNIAENPSPSSIFIEHYIDCIDSLPDDIQRNVSQLRELDHQYRGKLSQISSLLDMYNSTEDQANKQRYLTKIQRCLVKSQEYGDEKLQLISQIVEVADNKNLQMSRDSENLDAPIRRESSPLITKQDLAVNLEEQRGPPEKHQNKRPRRQKTVSERFADMQERLVKPEKATRIDKVSKAEKTSKNDKKATKVTERSDGNENEQMNAAVGVDIVNKKSNDLKKDREPVASKKKTGKQKDAKKKNGNAKKKKRKEVADIPIDPDEPTYCSCNQVSYGEMIGCDNEECPIEWFHFSCVKLTTKPKGKWYCPQCTAERREKGKK